MPVLNGNQYVKGILQANSLLFKEVIDTAALARGANIDLMTGKVYYKIDSNNIFEFVNKTELDTIIAQNGGSGVVTTVAGTAQEYDVMNLVNITFFSVNDTTKSYLLNLNFDTSVDVIKAGYSFDKVLSSIYKNGIIKKSDYQIFPILSIDTFQNQDVLGSFSSVKIDNSSASSIDQTLLDDLYFTNLADWSSTDVSAALDFLLIDNTDSTVIPVDSSCLLNNRFFSLNWLNYKLDIMDKRRFVSEFHKRIFNNESILYFMENYLSVYKDNNVTRLKMYFFDYRFLVYANIFHIIDHLKAVFDSPNDYSNALAQNIISYKNDHTDLTVQEKDYTAFEWDMNADELVECIFDSDTHFKDKIDQSTLEIVVSAWKWNLSTLNDPQFNELDLTDSQAFDYFGDGNFKPKIDRMHISQGDIWVPLFEIDFPLDSYFYFMM